MNIINENIEIRPITEQDEPAILNVYRNCEDFLALGPVAKASMEMVRKDIELSKQEGGIFCGIYLRKGDMIGIVDYVPNNYKGNSQNAYLSLLMIARQYRNQGIGEIVVNAIEKEIMKRKEVKVLLSGVQVNNSRAIQFWQRNGYQIISGPIRMPDQTTVFELRKGIVKP